MDDRCLHRLPHLAAADTGREMETMRSPLELEQAVEKGAAFLDEKAPAWRERVVLAELNMTDPCHCILGQSQGHFYEALPYLGIDGDEAVALGFDCGPHACDDSPCEYDALQALWIAELTRGI